MTEKTYDAKNIKQLKGVSAIRKRPNMYCGATNAQGVLHLVKEVIDNSTDEFMAGCAKTIKVTTTNKSITVEDDGRGIPVVNDFSLVGKKDIEISTKNNCLEKIITELHAGGKFDSDSYHISAGLNGVK